VTWLALDASGARAGLAVVDDDGAALASWSAPLKPGLIETLPRLLAEAVDGRQIDHVAVGIGPGSFTGLRTSLALAQGYCAAAGVPLWGVNAAAAYAVAFPQLHRPLWVVLRARKGRLFVLREGHEEAFADEDLPRPSMPIALAGDAAAEAAARLAARDADVLLTNARSINPLWVGRAAQAQRAMGQAPAPALPVYVDPPEAKLPAAGLRPPPV
jgi:tRNA threonylcarbamoyl adenosine modification protein YeaZ